MNPDKNRSSIAQRWILTVSILALVIAVRIFFLSPFSPVWIDEQVSINAACGDSSLASLNEDLLRVKLHTYHDAGILGGKIFTSNLANDRGNALLFDYMLSGWFLLAGCSFLSIKALPAILFLFTALLIIKLNGISSRSFIFLSILIVVHPLLYRYSLECRTYMLATMMTVAATITLFSYISAPKKEVLLIYFILAALALFSHYLVVPVLAWHFILLLKLSAQKKTYIIAWYAGFVFVLAGSLFLLNEASGFISMLGKASANLAARLDTGALWYERASPATIAGGISQVFLLMFGLSLQSIMQIRYFLVLALIVLVVIYFGYKSQDKEKNFIFWSLLLIHVLYLVTVSVLSGTNIIFQINYSIFMLPYYLIYTANTLTAINHKTLRISLQALIVAICVVNSVGYILEGR